MRTKVAIIDAQQRLISVLSDPAGLQAALAKLVEGARILSVPLVFTEQNPAKLGPTVEALQSGDGVIAKMEFDASSYLDEDDADIYVIAGCEAHICVAQTVAGLRGKGKQVMVPVDAIGSRSDRDKDIALRSMEANGAALTTVEALLFGWLGSAEHPRFREISKLIK